MMLKILCTFLFAFVFAPSSAGAQQLLLVVKNDVRMRLEAGDLILYKTQNQKRIQHEVIQGFLVDHIILKTDTVALSDIVAAGTPANSYASRFRSPGFKILVAGILLGVGDFVNVTVVQDKVYEAEPAVMAVTAVLTAAGAIMISKKPVVRLTRKKRLLIRFPDLPASR